jgi:hypothetical protein
MHSSSANKATMEQNFIDEGHKKTRANGGMSLACGRCRKLVRVASALIYSTYEAYN